jgi:hypothetical protein
MKEIQEIRVQPGIITVGEAVKRGLLLKDLLVRANPIAYKLEENGVKINDISLYLREEWDEIQELRRRIDVRKALLAIDSYSHKADAPVIYFNHLRYD